MSNHHDQESIDSLSEQLCDLYAEKDRLFKATGCTSAEEIILMFQSMEAQLIELYKDLDTKESQ